MDDYSQTCHLAIAQVGISYLPSQYCSMQLYNWVIYEFPAPYPSQKLSAL